MLMLMLIMKVMLMLMLIVKVIRLTAATIMQRIKIPSYLPQDLATAHHPMLLRPIPPPFFPPGRLQEATSAEEGLGGGGGRG